MKKKWLTWVTCSLCLTFVTISLISVCSLGTGWDKLGNGTHPPQAHSPWKGATLALP